MKEVLAWLASVCLAGLALWSWSNSIVLKPSYAVIDQNINELLAGTP